MLVSLRKDDPVPVPELVAASLEPVGTVAVQAIGRFKVADWYGGKEIAPITDINDRFKTLLFGVTEEPVDAMSLNISRLTGPSHDPPIMLALGTGKPCGKYEVTLGQFQYALPVISMSAYKEGDEDDPVPLVDDGFTVFGYVEVGGVICTVSAKWHDGWQIGEYPVPSQYEWPDGFYVLHR